MKKKPCLPAVPAALLCALCLGLSACGTLKAAFTQPVVSLRSVDIAALSLEGVRLRCTFEVENTNRLNLPFPEISWEFFIDGNFFLSGALPEGEDIAPGSGRILDIFLDLDYAPLAALARDRRELDYQIYLETRFLLPVQGEWIRSFESGGKIPLVQKISFRNPSFEILNLDFKAADIRFSLDLDNPNPFPVPFPDISYNFEVWNNAFLEGQVEHPDMLAAGSRSPVYVGFQILYSDLYRSFSALKDIGEASCLLSLSSRVSLPGYEEDRLSLDIPGLLPLLKEPVLNFRGISVRSISLSKIELEFGWDLDNLNSFSFEAGDLHYEILVNNSPWAWEQIEERMKIDPGGITPIPVSVIINSPSLVKELTDIITRGKDMLYDIKGGIVFYPGPARFSDSPVPFELSGWTRLRR
jgi:LEA14-like dessication related protein